MSNQIERKNQIIHDVTLKDVCLDMLISSVIIAGAGLTSALGKFFFSDGIPFSDSVLIYARTVISILWAVRMVVRYTVITCREVNAAVLDLIDTEVWKTSQSILVNSCKYLWRCWKNMNNFPRYLMILLLVIGLSFALYTLTQNLADLWLPPTYSVATLLFAYFFGQENLSQREIRRYWTIILILFCIIQIAMSIGVIDLFNTANTNLFAELWELIRHLPHAQLSLDNNLRILISMSTMYLLAHNIYQRHEADLVGYADNLKRCLQEQVSSYQRFPALSMV